ncbi:Formin-like protein [Quillaja saponaria]|uniref:Formin-like protein n=1 Tax=Quillaja saponaria TaxID=32244 RepID=A0AAD7KZ60_QUISA|nr:Formin-like protein [Quillaja saponaria]
MNLVISTVQTPCLPSTHMKRKRNWNLVPCISDQAVSSEDRRRTEADIVSQLLDPASGLLDEDTAELIWISCRQDLIHLKEHIEDLDLDFPPASASSTNEINSKVQSHARQNIQKLVNFHNLQLKRTILDCLRKNSLPLHVSGEEDHSKFCYARYLETLLSRSSVRRILGGELLQKISEAPSPGPLVGSPPSYTTASPAPKPFIPQGSYHLAASTKKSSFSDLGKSSLRLSANKTSSKSQPSGSKVKATKKKKSSTKQVVAAVVITAVVTFVLAALLFLCCCRFSRTRSGIRQNDERPLLTLSLSDYSVGIYFPSILSHLLLQLLVVGAKSSAEPFGASSSINGQVSHLPPPPGRPGAGPSGLPPLTPPPGWPDPLPPEPPSFKPSVGNSCPCPPPPPAPAPPVKAPGIGGPPPPRPPPPPVPAPPGAKPSSRPRPPVPKAGIPPPRPPQSIAAVSKLTQPSARGSKAMGVGEEGEADAPKTKLKPFFWDKVQASPDHSMVWSQIKSGSFQFNEEMMESLFGYNSVDKNKGERKESSSQSPTPQFIQIIDSKKAQNLSILLRALNVTIEEVCDAINEGNELPSEFLQTLLKMAPTSEEELKLRLFRGELSQLGPAERFLKTLVNIPFAFKRLEALLFMCTLQEEVTVTKESFATLEVACQELRSSRLFLKLLEAVLKTGNRMNNGTFRGGAQAFKLDTLLKLADVKGTDGKTTLLHFVVQEIIRYEGIRTLRVARESRSFSSIISDDLLEDTNQETEEHYRDIGLQRTMEGSSQTLESFVQNAETEVTQLLEEEKRIMALVKSTGDYFHGNAGKDEGLRLFVIVRDFLIMLDKACKEVRAAPKKPTKTQKQEAPRLSPSSDLRQPPSPHLRQQLFPAITDRRMENSSSDDDSP